MTAAIGMLFTFLRRPFVPVRDIGACRTEMQLLLRKTAVTSLFWCPKARIALDLASSKEQKFPGVRSRRDFGVFLPPLSGFCLSTAALTLPGER